MPNPSPRGAKTSNPELQNLQPLRCQTPSLGCQIPPTRGQKPQPPRGKTPTMLEGTSPPAPNPGTGGHCPRNGSASEWRKGVGCASGGGEAVFGGGVPGGRGVQDLPGGNLLEEGVPPGGRSGGSAAGGEPCPEMGRRTPPAVLTGKRGAGAARLPRGPAAEGAAPLRSSAPLPAGRRFIPPGAVALRGNRTLFFFFSAFKPVLPSTQQLHGHGNSKTG